MVYYDMKQYRLVKFEKSTKPNKKYDALIYNKDTDKTVRVSFGDNRYESYQDLTGINAYRVHNDKQSRRLYRERHEKEYKYGYFSPSYFSWHYLW